MQITHIRFGAPTKSHEFIDWLMWRHDSGGSEGESATSTIVRWIDNGGEAHIGTGADRVTVRTVHRAGAEPYLQGQVGEAWTNHLLELPEF
jgi:hypothetical protein